MDKKSLFLAIMCTSGFLLGCSPQKSSEEYFQTALQSYEAKDYKTATIDLKNLLSNDANNPQARLLLAKTYFYSGNFESSQKEFSTAIKLGIENVQVLPYMVRLNFLIGNLEDLEENLEDIRLLTLNDKIPLHTILGINYLYSGKSDTGFELLSQVMRDGPQLPDNIYVQMAKISVAAKDGQLEQAIVRIAELVDKDNEFNDALLLQSKLLVMAQQSEKALQSYHSFLALQPYHYLIRMEYIQLLIINKQLAQAEEQVNGLLASFPYHPLVNGLKAEIVYRQSNFEQAVEYAAKALNHLPDHTKLNLISGVSYYKMQRFEMAYNQLIAIENRLPSEHPAYNMLLDLKFKMGYIDDALTDIDAKREFNKTDLNILTQASIALLSEGQDNKAQKYVNQMDDSMINSPEALNMRGNLKLEMNDPSGYDDLNKAIEMDPQAVRPRLSLLYSYLKKQEFDKAMQVASDWLLVSPDKEYGHLAYGIVYSSVDNKDAANKSFESALQVNPKSAGALYNLAKLAFSANDFKKSQSYSNQLLSINPEHRGAINNLIKLSSFIDTSEIISTFQSLKQQYPDSINLGVGYARALFLSDNKEGAIKEMESLSKLGSENSMYLRTFAGLSVNMKEFGKAEQYYQKVLELQPNKLSNNIDYLNILERQGKFQQAVSHLQKMQQLFADNLLLNLYEAKLALASDRVERAATILDEVKLDKDNKAFFNRLQVARYAKQKDIEKALIYSEQLYLGFNNSDNAFNYARLLFDNDESEKALAVVERFLQENADDNRFLALKAEINTKVNPYESLEYFKKMHQKQPDNFVILNNLAWSAIQAQQYELGLREAEKAVSLSNNNPLVLDTLAVAHLRMGNYQKAEKILTEVSKKLPENQQVNLHLAEVLIHLNRFDESKALLNKVDDGPNKELVMNLLHKVKEST